MAEDRTTVYEDSHRLDNPLQERTTIRVPLATMDVSFTPRFGVQGAVTVPDVTRSAVVSRNGAPVNFRETFSGLGDSSLLAWYRFRPIHRWGIVANGGVSLPTGHTERPRFRSELADGSFVPLSRLQRGTGTVDPIFGVNVSRMVEPLTIFASVAARIPVAENSYGLRTGASWEASGGLASEIGTHRVSGYARLGWLHREQDVFEGRRVLVGGGDWFYLTPGAAVRFAPKATFQAEIKLPIYRAVSNRQLDSRAVFQIGVSRAF